MPCSPQILQSTEQFASLSLYSRCNGFTVCVSLSLGNAGTREVPILCMGSFGGRGKAKGHVLELQTQSRSVLKEITNINCISPRKAVLLPYRFLRVPFPHTLSSSSRRSPSPPNSLVAFGCCYPDAASQLRAQESAPWDNTQDAGLLLPPWGAGAAAGLAGGSMARGTIYHRARLARPVPRRESRTALPTALASHGHQRSRVCFTPAPAELFPGEHSESHVCLGPLSFVCFENDPLSLRHTQEEEFPAGQGGTEDTALQPGPRARAGLQKGPRHQPPHSTGCAGTIPGEGGTNLPRWSGAI